MPTESLVVPLVTGADAVVRVAGTRVTLDTLVLAIQEGASAEEIAQQYHISSRRLRGDRVLPRTS